MDRLPERYVRLLTAYVDGELSAEQSQLARRLLHRSSRARTLYKQLRANAERLRQLPRHELGVEFVQDVMRSVSQPALPLPATGQPVGWLRRWGAALLAASILIAVASAAFLLFEPGKTNDVHVKKEDDLLPIEQPPGRRIALSDPALDREFARANAIHLEVSCRDKARTIAELKDAFNANGIQMVIDAAADLNGDFLVYAEDLDGSELADILRRQKQFDAVYVNPLDELDRRAVASRLGRTPQEFGPPPPARIELKKMIRKDERRPSQPVEPSAERIAVVLADAGVAIALSEELQRFIQQRRQRPGTLQVILVLHETRV